MRRIHRHSLGHKEDLNRWLISYADYMTLLFALFVVLYAVAMVNEEQYEKIMFSFKAATHQMSNPSLKLIAKGILPYDENIIIEQDGSGLINPEDRATDGDTELSLYKKQKLGASLTGLKNKLNDVLVELISSGEVKLEDTDDWLMIELSNEMVFPGGSASLTNHAKFILSGLAEILSSVNNFVRVRGYTDNSPISNEIFSSNWELSSARAASVLIALEKSGIASPRLAIEAYGQFYPFSDNDSEEHRKQNRKVVIALSKFAWVPKSKAKTFVEPHPVIGKPPVEDSKTILTVPIDGGFRITTRQD